MGIRFRWLGFVCYEIVLPSGKVLVTDPYINYSPTAPVECEDVTGADYIAITHGHFDHCSDVGYLAKKFNSIIICSQKIVEPLTKFFDLNPAKVKGVTPGSDLTFDDLKVEIRKAQHVDIEGLTSEAYEAYEAQSGQSLPAGIPFHKLLDIFEGLSPRPDRSPAIAEMRNKMFSAGIREGETFNYIFQTSDNMRLYLFSSSHLANMRQQIIDAHPNVSLVQLSGLEPVEAAQIAALSGAELVIPTHHDGKWLGKMQQRAQEMAKHLATMSRAKFLNIDLGKWYEIGVNISGV